MIGLMPLLGRGEAAGREKLTELASGPVSASRTVAAALDGVAPRLPVAFAVQGTVHPVLPSGT